MIRVLVVDDSPTSREAIVSVLRTDPIIEIVGEAGSGTEAVELAESLRPNVITMDVVMPGMNGFDATKEVMIRTPTPTLIVTSHLDVHDKLFEGNSFRAGAVGTLPKPPDVDDPLFENFAKELVGAVREIASMKVSRHWRYAPQLQPRGGAVEVRAIAASVSLQRSRAFAALVAGLPAEFPAALMVVAQVGSGFGPGFTVWLDRQSALRVKLGEDGEPIEPGTVYVAPENRHLAIGYTRETAHLVLSDAPARRGYRPSAGVLFETAASVYGPGMAALLFEGHSEDALLGLCSVRLSGGRVLVHRDERTTVPFRSPLDALAEGLADAVLPVDKMIAQLREVCRRMPEPERLPMEGGSLRLAS